MSRKFDVKKEDVEWVTIEETQKGGIPRNLPEMKALREEVRGTDDFNDVNDAVHALEACVIGVTFPTPKEIENPTKNESEEKTEESMEVESSTESEEKNKA